MTDTQSPSLNPWHPMTRPIDLKYIGKLGEECNELGSAIFRCIIQGIDEREPVTDKLNREWLEDEIADVLANSALVIEHYGLDKLRMEARIAYKRERLRAWHANA